MILETIPAIRSLTTEQKMRLSYELADEVSQIVDLTPELQALLDRRLDAYEANPTAAKKTEDITVGLMTLKQSLAGTSHHG